MFQSLLVDRRGSGFDTLAHDEASRRAATLASVSRISRRRASASSRTRVSLAAIEPVASATCGRIRAEHRASCRTSSRAAASASRTAFNAHLGAGRAGGRLQRNGRQPEPALDDVAREVNVLDAAVGQQDLAAEQDAPLHRDAAVVEFVSQRVVLEEQRQQHERRQAGRSEARQQVVLHQPRVGPRDFVRAERIRKLGWSLIVHATTRLEFRWQSGDRRSSAMEVILLLIRRARCGSSFRGLIINHSD